MKVVTYKRFQASGLHITFFSNAQVLYNPELAVVIFSERRASFGEPKIGVNDGEKDEGLILKEAQKIFETGKAPKYEKGAFGEQPLPSFEGISYQEYEETFLKDLVAIIRKMEVIENQVRMDSKILFKP